MNCLVTGIVATLTISVTVAWWVLLAEGATWLVSNWITRSVVVEARNTLPLPSVSLEEHRQSTVRYAQGGDKTEDDPPLCGRDARISKQRALIARMSDHDLPTAQATSLLEDTESVRREIQANRDRLTC